ncbi:MAG TPA: T9SS type A sorting domain-containing protein, partial [Flavipsychrobacter sp.]|nr:T9SS type A sorting domain-containing protein [Flavipsychrobacter sp.]
SKGYHFIAVFDMQGKPVVWQKFNADNSRELQLNTSTWPSGTYRVVVQKGNTQKVLPVVKL